jgi:hypothetical protein
MSEPAEMRMFDLGLAKGIEIGEERAKERIIKLLEGKRGEIEKIVTMSDELGETSAKWFYQDRIKELNNYIALMKEEK